MTIFDDLAQHARIYQAAPTLTHADRLAAAVLDAAEADRQSLLAGQYAALRRAEAGIARLQQVGDAVDVDGAA